jgi:hydrogenase maturation protein HypF
MTIAASPRTRVRVRVEGVVQGVGFRPFVHALAAELGLGGFVGNDPAGVFIEVEGERAAVARFVDALRSRAPALAVVEHVTVQPATPVGDSTFRIVPSDAGESRRALVSADAATCPACLREVLDPGDRRHRYPFTNCTDCGPRFTIVVDVPYDRGNTTMAGFAMCADCATEYADPRDRRFHAQPVCCPVCGPKLRLLDRDGVVVPGDALVAAAGRLLRGEVLAVKGLGGYHLAAVADHDTAVATLRARKHREDKPFAVLARDVAAARTLVEVDAAAEQLMSSPARPIVLLPRLPRAPVAPAVAPGNRRLGVLLPYTPLHHLLARGLGRPLVLTSGNVSDEPIAFRDDEALQRLGGIADGFLLHDRPIHVRTDDSVVRVFRGRPMPVRRSRGYVPAPVTVPWEAPRPVLACGAELKNTFSIAKGRHVFVSHHIGDLENLETFRAFTEGIGHYGRLFDVQPQVVAHDLHPEYLSTKYALEMHDTGDVDLAGVQHHHAHIASCLADNGEPGPVIGVALDGLGYGTDGTLWGGELLVADLAGFSRAGHLEPVPMPGGAAAVREPWRMAAAYLQQAYDGALPDDLPVVRRNADRWSAVTAMAGGRVNAPLTSSAGRLFDAVSALLGVRDRVTFEGQAAVELEQLADIHEHAAFPLSIAPVPDGPLVLRGADLVRAVVDDIAAGVDPRRIAARFHNGLADGLVTAVGLVRERTGLGVVALSGGVFQNGLLLDRMVTALEGCGFRVLVHSRVPPNDGGISLGQAVVAAARDRAAHQDPPVDRGRPAP